MRFEVLQEDIDNGEKGDPFACPIALAISRQLPERHVSVGKDWILIEKLTIVNPGDALRHYSPFSAYRFVKRFDKGKSVKPFGFDLDVEPTKLRGKGMQLEEMRETSAKR